MICTNWSLYEDSHINTDRATHRSACISDLFHANTCSYECRLRHKITISGDVVIPVLPSKYLRHAYSFLYWLILSTHLIQARYIYIIFVYNSCMDVMDALEVAQVDRSWWILAGYLLSYIQVYRTLLGGIRVLFWIKKEEVSDRCIESSTRCYSIQHSRQYDGHFWYLFQYRNNSEAWKIFHTHSYFL